MKTTIITSVLLVLAVFMSNAKTKNAVTQFGTYAVHQTDNANAVVKASNNEYTIHYEQFDAPVSVKIVKKGKYKIYLVRTQGYEVQYVCNGNKFGVEYMSEGFATQATKEMKKKINRTAFLYQRVLSQEIKSEKEYVRLIACFLPELMS